MAWWNDPANRSPVIEEVVSWVEQLRKYAPPKSRGDPFFEYLECLVYPEKYMEKVDDDEDEDNDDENNSANSTEDPEMLLYFIDDVATKLNFAAIYIFLEDYLSALFHLRQLLNLTKLQTPDRNRRAVEMIRDSLFWTLGFLYGGLQISSVMEYNWILEVGGNDQVDALLDFMKGQLAVDMGINQKVVLAYQRQAVQKDQWCPTWYHFIYRSVRQIRVGARASPMDAERKPVESAYDLTQGRDFVALTDYALYLKEILWPQTEMEWNCQEEEYLAVVRFYGEAIRLAEEVECKPWADKLEVDLAEFLAFGKGQLLDHQEGKEMLDSLVVRDPYNYLVFQLAGKLYHQVNYN